MIHRIKFPIKEVPNRLKMFFSQKGILFLEIILLILICVLHAFSAGHSVNFFPINGTYQNFNPVRRLLAGQVPYRDFIDYLGMGHLYLGAAATAIFGGSYQKSLIAFTFLTLFGFAAFSLVIGKAVLKKTDAAVTVTNLVLLMLMIRPLFFVNAIGLTEDVMVALDYALGTGNSARFVRGAILPLSVILLWGGEKIYRPYIERYNERKRKFFHLMWAGTIAGFSFAWSNDYGISCWVCMAVMTFWVSFTCSRNAVTAAVDFFIELLISMISLFLFVEIFTLGHFREWFRNVFGTGGYQFWYFNSSKSYYIFDVDISCIMLIQALLAVVFLVFLFMKGIDRETMRRYGIPGFVNMTCFCAVNEYKLLSGGSNREVALVVLFLTVLFETIHLFKRNQKVCRSALIASIVIGFSWIVSTAKNEAVFFFMANKEGQYVAELGGNMTHLAGDLEAASQFLKGEEFWAAYASAQEVVEDSFQPSGTDYIIHVLGDEQRETYMSRFREGDFKYAATIRKDYTDFEYWIERANWFFYRELYKDWHPVFSNAYEIYWERNDSGEEHMVSDDFEVQIVEINDSTVKLIIQTDENLNGVADIYIDYSVEKKQGSRSAKLLLQSVLKVQNTGTVRASDAGYESNYLRQENAEYIPMHITNGYGELTLTACPDRSVFLNLKEVRCNSVYTVKEELL